MSFEALLIIVCAALFASVLVTHIKAYKKALKSDNYFRSTSTAYSKKAVQEGIVCYMIFALCLVALYVLGKTLIAVSPGLSAWAVIIFVLASLFLGRRAYSEYRRAKLDLDQAGFM